MQKRNFVICVLSAFLLSISFLFVSFKFNAFALGDTIISTESKSCFLIEPNSKTVIFSKNENEKRPIASMCKIMTLLLIFEEIDSGNLSLENDVTVSENASKMGGSQVFLEENGVYPVKELVKSIVVASANDSCVAMAETICGSEEAFVNKMNSKCSELNMKDTVFVNCTGLPKPGQFSCAKDVATMFLELIKHEEYFSFANIWMDKIEHPGDRFTEISNTNKLIRFYEGCDSGKTGFTQEAGHCLCASAIRNDTRLVSVVISAPDSKTRFKDVSSMFNYGFANYVNKIIVDKNTKTFDGIKVFRGKSDTLVGAPEESIFLFSKKNEERVLDVKFLQKENLTAPIYKGDVVGVLEAYENGVLVSKTNVCAIEDVEKANYFDYFKDVAQNWTI